MPTPTNVPSGLIRHREANATRVNLLIEKQYNTGGTRGAKLDFTSSSETDAAGLGRRLLAKGLRPLQPTPQADATCTWYLRAGVKRSLREITAEEFICDLITLASGVHSCFDMWELLADDTAEQMQPHPDTPDAKGGAK